jgi:O-antigen/teichoic acid export membrane protein
VRLVYPALLLSGYLGRAGTQFVILWAFARESGSAGAGEFALAFAVATPVFVLFDLALRNVYQTLQDAPAFRTYLRIRLVSAGAAALLLGAADAAGVLEVRASILVPLLVMKAADTVLDLCCARLQVVKRIPQVAALNWLNTVLTLVLVSFSLATGLGAEVALAGSALASVGTLGAAVPLLGRHPDTGRGGPAAVQAILRAGVTLGLAQTLTAALTYVPTWYLASGADTRAVGVFAACQYTVTLTALFLNSLTQTWLSDLRRIYDAEGRAALNRHASRIGIGTQAIATLGGALTLVLLVPVLPWVFGPDFEISYMVALPFALTIVALGVEAAVASVLLVLNKYGSRLATAVAANLSAVVLALITVNDASILTAGYVLLLGVATRCLASTVTLIRARPAPAVREDVSA